MMGQESPPTFFMGQTGGAKERDNPCPRARPAPISKAEVSPLCANRIARGKAHLVSWPSQEAMKARSRSLLHNSPFHCVTYGLQMCKDTFLFNTVQVKKPIWSQINRKSDHVSSSAKEEASCRYRAEASRPGFLWKGIRGWT